jgi:hypothetical protein
MTGNLHDKRACLLNEISDRCNKVAGHVLTLKPDHLGGADQSDNTNPAPKQIQDFMMFQGQTNYQRNLEKGYNTVRPLSALGSRLPAPESIVQMDQKPVIH